MIKFLKEHKRIFIVLGIILIIILIGILKNLKKENTVSNDVSYESEDNFYNENYVEEPDETQNTRYPDIVYGVE